MIAHVSEGAAIKARVFSGARGKAHVPEGAVMKPFVC